MFGLVHAVAESSSTAGGLTTADLIAILSVVVIIFGLLLTAIGVLVLRSFSQLDSRITELKNDVGDDLRAVWHELGAMRCSTPVMLGGRRRSDPPR